MDTQNQIHQYLKKITDNFNSDNDRKVLAFLRNLGKDTLKELDVYCFHSKSGRFLVPPKGLKIISLTLIRPLPDSDYALCVSLLHSIFEDRDSINIRLGTFNLTATAGNPVDLAAVRIEKLILDSSEGDTLSKIKWLGTYRKYKKVFDETYIEKRVPELVKVLKNIFPKSERQKIKEEIIFSLKNLENSILFLIENPDFNRLKSRDAINY